MRRIFPGNAGFALVDILIALLVIALLLGSLVVGQRYFRGAQVRELIVQYQMFETARQAFSHKYRALPGDMRHTAAHAAGLTALGGGEGQGDGDGLLEGAGGLVGSRTTGAGETTLFWLHLHEAGLLREPYDGSQAAGGIGDTFPRATTGMGGWAVFSGTAASGGQGRNFFQLGRPSFGGGGTIHTADALGPEEASAFDLKLDDGRPARGAIVARGGDRLDQPASHAEGQARCLTAPYRPEDETVAYALGPRHAGSRSCQLRIRFHGLNPAY